VHRLARREGSEFVGEVGVAYAKVGLVTRTELHVHDPFGHVELWRTESSFGLPIIVRSHRVRDTMLAAEKEDDDEPALATASGAERTCDVSSVLVRRRRSRRHADSRDELGSLPDALSRALASWAFPRLPACFFSGVLPLLTKPASPAHDLGGVFSARSLPAAPVLDRAARRAHELANAV